MSLRKIRYNLDDEKLHCSGCRCCLPSSLYQPHDLRKYARGLSFRCMVCRMGYTPKTLPDEPIKFSGGDWYAALSYWGAACAVCKSDRYILLDHWYPRGSQWARGHVPQNVVPLCAKCNTHKRDYHPHAWLIGEFGAVKGHILFNRIELYLLIARDLDWQILANTHPKVW